MLDQRFYNVLEFLVIGAFRQNPQAVIINRICIEILKDQEIAC